jgi:hypothetical protein
MSIGAPDGIRTENASYTSQKVYCLSQIARCKRYKNWAIKQILSSFTFSKQSFLNGAINQLHGAELFRSLQSLRYSRNFPPFCVKLSFIAVFTKALHWILSEPSYSGSNPPILLLQSQF